MNEPTAADIEAARAITYNALEDEESPELNAKIAAAIAKARQEGYDEGYDAGMSHAFCIDATTIKGNSVDCTGEVPVVRRAFGKLPVTKDGAIAMPGQLVWPSLAGPYWVTNTHTIAVSVLDDDGKWRDMRVDECYSTREAALAAKEAANGKA